MIGSGGAVIKTHSGVEFAGSSGNRLLDDALVDRTLESVVTVVLGIPMKSARHTGNQHSQGTTCTHNEHCVQPCGISRQKTGANMDWNEN